MATLEQRAEITILELIIRSLERLPETIDNAANQARLSEAERLAMHKAHKNRLQRLRDEKTFKVNQAQGQGL